MLCVENIFSGNYIFQCSVIRQSKGNQDRGIKKTKVNTVYKNIENMEGREGASENFRVICIAVISNVERNVWLWRVLYYL